MDGEWITWVFLIGGIVLMLLEALIPGGVTFVLGFSGLTIGILRYLGFLEDPFTATFTWLLSSMALTILIRPFIKKYFPGCLLYTSPSPRDLSTSRMPSSA